MRFGYTRAHAVQRCMHSPDLRNAAVHLYLNHWSACAAPCPVTTSPRWSGGSRTTQCCSAPPNGARANAAAPTSQPGALLPDGDESPRMKAVALRTRRSSAYSMGYRAVGPRRGCCVSCSSCTDARSATRMGVRVTDVRFARCRAGKEGRCVECKRAAGGAAWRW